MPTTLELQQLRELFRGNKGRPIGAFTGRSDGVVVVGGGENAIWVTTTDGRVLQVYNDAVGIEHNIPVWIGPDPLNKGVIKVLGVRQVFGAKKVVASVANHGDRHLWPYGDWHFVAPQQFTPGLVYPYSDGNTSVNVIGLPFQNQAREWVIGESRILDLSASVPVSGACWALIYYDNSGLLQTSISGTVASRSLLTTDDIPTTDYTSIAAVILYAGQTDVKMDPTTNTYDIVDLRWARREAYDGSTRYSVAVKNANYTLTTSDSVVVFTATATATLPNDPAVGTTYRIICRAGTLTIDGDGSDTIKGETTQSITAGEDLIITYTATGIWE